MRVFFICTQKFSEVLKNLIVAVSILWTGIDYLGESGKWSSRGFYSGLLDFAGFIKPRGYFRQSLWSGKPAIYLGTYPVRGGNRSEDVLSSTVGKKEETLSMDAWPEWNYKDGQTIRVVCYTNAAKVQLMLNNRQLGAIKDYDNKTGIIYWDVPYQPGELKAEGIDAAGNVISVSSIKTSDDPYAIEVIPLSNNNKAQVAQVAVQITDKNGRPVMHSDTEISCSITGGATLLGLEAGNNSDMGDYTDNKQRTFRGGLMAYIRRNGRGTVRLVFSAPHLKETVIIL